MARGGRVPPPSDPLARVPLASPPVHQIDLLLTAIEDWQLSFDGDLERLAEAAPPPRLVRWYVALGGSHLIQFRGGELYSAALTLQERYLSA